MVMVLGFWGAQNLVAPWAAANSGKKFLETVGTSTAIGTVLGASTLPFYTEPKKHLGNVLIGAAAGLVVGLGIWVYTLFDRPSEDQYYYYDSSYRHWDLLEERTAATQYLNPLQTLVWTPVVSLSL